MCFTIKLSAGTRKCLLILVLFLTILHFIVGVVLVVVGLWAPTNFNVKLLPAETQLIQQVVGSLVALGGAAVTLQLLGVVTCRAAAAPHRHSRSGCALLVWASAAMVLAACEAAAAALAPFYARALSLQLRRTLHRGISAYLVDLHWKTEMDNLQQRHACCGVERPSDWQRTVWLQPRHLRADSRTVLLYTEADGRVLPPVLPFSCCAPAAPPPCFHDPLQQATVRSAWEERVEDVQASVRSEGCASTLLVPLQEGLYAAAAALAASAIVQVLVLMVMRLVYTAARNAALRGLPRGTGRAWLWGRGDLQLACGRTLEQLDEWRTTKRLLQRQREQEAAHLKKKKKEEGKATKANVAHQAADAAWETQDYPADVPKKKKDKNKK